MYITRSLLICHVALKFPFSSFIPKKSRKRNFHIKGEKLFSVMSLKIISYKVHCLIDGACDGMETSLNLISAWCQNIPNATTNFSGCFPTEPAGVT